MTQRISKYICDNAHDFVQVTCDCENSLRNKLPTSPSSHLPFTTLLALVAVHAQRNGSQVRILPWTRRVDRQSATMSYQQGGYNPGQVHLPIHFMLLSLVSNLAHHTWGSSHDDEYLLNCVPPVRLIPVSSTAIRPHRRMPRSPTRKHRSRASTASRSSRSHTNQAMHQMHRALTLGRSDSSLHRSTRLAHSNRSILVHMAPLHRHRRTPHPPDHHR